MVLLYLRVHRAGVHCLAAADPPGIALQCHSTLRAITRFVGFDFGVHRTEIFCVRRGRGRRVVRMPVAFPMSGVLPMSVVSHFVMFAVFAVPVVILGLRLAVPMLSRFTRRMIVTGVCLLRLTGGRVVVLHTEWTDCPNGSYRVTRKFLLAIRPPFYAGVARMLDDS